MLYALYLLRRKYSRILIIQTDHDAHYLDNKINMFSYKEKSFTLKY